MKENMMLVNDITISTKNTEQITYISLTDIGKYKNSDDPNDVIKNWLRNRMTIEFLGIWEKIHNPNFKPVEFDGFRMKAGLGNFVMSPTKWITATNAKGIIVSAGKYGGTYAHSDIALEFANWVSVEFRLYMVTEFQRLKEQETINIEWSAKRELAKINYHIHTDAIKTNLIVPTLKPQQKSYKYASEADLLNVAMFGRTASAWKLENVDKDGNMRDYASIHQLLVLANMESYNAVMIEKKMTQEQRLQELNDMAKKQLQILLDVDNKLYLPNK